MIDTAFNLWRDSLATHEGVEAASEHFFRELRRFVGAIVFTTLRRHDPFLTQDIVTRVFLKAKQFQGTSTFGTWVWRLAYNQCLNDLRTKRRRKEVFLDDLLAEPVSPEKAPSEIIEVLAGLRDQLERSENQLIDWRLEGYLEPEIAEKLGVSRNEVKRLWRNTRNKIRKLLGESSHARS